MCRILPVSLDWLSLLFSLTFIQQHFTVLILFPHSFRISAHDLSIERGRYTGIKANARICNLCNTEIEDELHFLHKCSSTSDVRNHISDIISSNYENFNILKVDNKFYGSLHQKLSLFFENFIA